MTEVVRADAEAIERAARLLLEGEIVAFPTETVYGLGADARRSDAVEKIYVAKGRPPTRALICHVEGKDGARRLVEGWDHRAEALSSAFWPGPLTLVLPKKSIVPEAVTGGGPTVAVRAPRHPVAQALIAALRFAIAAPSANRSSRISPTLAEHVLSDLGGLIPMILDGGPTSVGLESTVLDLSGPVVRVLRSGAVTPSAVESVLGERVEDAGLAPSIAARVPIHLFEREPPEEARLERAAVLWIGRAREESAHSEVMPDDPTGYARALYEALRRAEACNIEAIWVEMPLEGNAWSAIRARLCAVERK
jgi:L-threonylcarbamoyladenylate synthase